MPWIIAVGSLIVLALLARAARRPVLDSYREAPLDDELLARVGTVATRCKTSGTVRLRVGKRTLRRLERLLRRLNRTPREQQLPAVQWLTDNGRFLQETVASMVLDTRRMGRLPRVESGEARATLFARTLLSHANAELNPALLIKAMEAWQDASPFHEDELLALPVVLRATLIRILMELLAQCAREQRDANAAPVFAQMLTGGKGKRVERIFERMKQSPTFLTHLLAELRALENANALAWLDARTHGMEPSPSQLAEAELERQTENRLWVGNAVTSLRVVARTPWRQISENASLLHEALTHDPSGVYERMDEESRGYYRARAVRFARLCGATELSVGRMSVTLSQMHASNDLAAHVGYYLLDDGVPLLLTQLRGASARVAFALFLRKHRGALYRASGWAAFAALLALCMALGLPAWLWLPFVVCFLQPMGSLRAALLRRLTQRRMTPRLRLDAVPDGLQTLVVCPTLLTDKEQALHMIKRLAVMRQANPDPRLHFLLLGDSPDSVTGTLADDEAIVTAAAMAVKALREDSKHPFFYLQRARVYNARDHVYMSRERKRGGVDTILRILESRPIEDQFTYCSCPRSELQGRYRYVITLDSDTLLPPGSALRMIGAMAHPLQQRRVYHERLRGISVLQPRMETAAHTVGNPLTALLGGRGGTEPYNALYADELYDLAGSGTFMGKGIIDPKGFLSGMEGNVIPGAILSHDLLEGELTGCDNATDIALYDSQPATLRAFLLRLHRWTRGDWQLLPYLLPIFPAQGRAPKAGLSRMSKHKLWANLVRSLFAPMRLIVALAAVGLGNGWLLAAALLLAELPSLWRADARALAALLVRLLSLPGEALLTADAIGRTLYRLLISRQHLLQWTTAAQLMQRPRKPSPLLLNLSLSIGGACALLALAPGGLFWAGMLIGGGWAAFPVLLPILEQPRARREPVTFYMREELTRIAKSTFRYFETVAAEREHFLPPDNLQIDPDKGAAPRTSPTNIGLYLASLIAAEKLGLLSPADMAERLERTLTTIEGLPTSHGHPYNWYDTRTLLPLRPYCVSSVDSGNYAACLLACAQGVRALLPELPSAYHPLAARLDALAEQIDFGYVYDPDAELFYIVRAEGQPGDPLSHYDLLASEARLLSYVAIMLGQIPVRHWYRLGRGLTRTAFGNTLVSYSGTMFEYLLPLLFQPLVRDTLLWQSCRRAAREQRRCRQQGVYGVSESGYYAFDPELYYLYKAFGVPSLALDPIRNQRVVAPYASALTLTLSARAAFRNLQKLQGLGMEGPLGLYEAVDFDPERIGDQPRCIVHSHMSHHQGMILLSICNLLSPEPFDALFSSLPRAQAYRLLLEEKPARSRLLIRRPLKRVEPEKQLPTLKADRLAYPLSFPIDAHLLHGADTTVLIDAQGNGYMAHGGVMLTRFHESCALPSGVRFLVRDSQTGAHWSATEPTAPGTTEFDTSQASFLRKVSHIESRLRCFVNPLDGTVVHQLTLRNLSAVDRMLEAISYLEPSLAPRKDDQAHPAFQNLFVRTSRPSKTSLMAERRPRGNEGETLLLVHALTSDLAPTAFHAQTDRAAFLGQGNQLERAQSLELPISALTDRVGSVIDPCMSLRAQFVVPVQGQVQLVFTTAVFRDKADASAFLERYAHPESAAKAAALALTKGLVTARHLGLQPSAQNLIGKMIGSLAYAGQPHQAQPFDRDALPLSALWGLRISGDLPILLLELDDAKELFLPRLLLKAHAYYRMCGFWCDLVLAFDQSADPSLEDKLKELIGASQSKEQLGLEGGVHMLETNALGEALLRLLRRAARLALRQRDGSLPEQLQRTLYNVKPMPTRQTLPPRQWPELPLEQEVLLFDNGYGGFTQNSGDYVIHLPAGRCTPAPWSNPLCNARFGTLATESGLAFTYAGNSHQGRLTRWPNDSVALRSDESYWIKDAENGLLWSLTRWPAAADAAFRVTHAPGVTVYESNRSGISQKLVCFTDADEALGARVITLRNEGKTPRTLQCLQAVAFWLAESDAGRQLTALEKRDGLILAHNPGMAGLAAIAMLDPAPSVQAVMSPGVFDGLTGELPFALTQDGALADGVGCVGIQAARFTLKPRESITLTLAICHGEDEADIRRMLALLHQQGATQRLHRVRAYWEVELGALRFDLPDAALTLLLNRWLPYQVRAARLWMRAGFYQAGGAFGFRDQLQDMLALLPVRPLDVREHLLTCAAHQFEEGDVQHWWHPPRRGVRTRVSDDMLFLPYVLALYVQSTADTALLTAQVPYLSAPPLGPDERERVEEPAVSDLRESMLQHGLRAIERVRLGAHGLPLMGGGDWNDGMNLVGGENGESVWLAMFYCEVLRAFAPLCAQQKADELYAKRIAMLSRIDEYAWDGSWYLRAWYSDGTPLGAASSRECRLDALPQCWAVLSGVSRERAAIAMDSLWRANFDGETGILKLFTPPFDGEQKPGYIAGYLPGVRENGGQYTHAVPWAIAALHQLGRDDLAWQLTQAALPIRHSQTRQAANRYRVEPYVMAADVYAAPDQLGRGGWTWYTGSAAWLLHVVLTQLFGFQKIGDTLRLRPSVPEVWEGFTLTYQFGNATYRLHASKDCACPMADGERLPGGVLLLRDDGRIHEATFPIRSLVPTGGA